MKWSVPSWWPKCPWKGQSRIVRAFWASVEQYILNALYEARQRGRVILIEDTSPERIVYDVLTGLTRLPISDDAARAVYYTLHHALKDPEELTRDPTMSRWIAMAKEV